MHVLRVIGSLTFLVAVIVGLSIAAVYVTSRGGGYDYRDSDADLSGFDSETVNSIRLSADNSVFDAVSARHSQELRVAMDDLIDWSAAPEDDDTLSELFAVCNGPLVAPSRSAGGALPDDADEGAGARFCADVRRDVLQHTAVEWSELARSQLPIDSYPLVGVGPAAVEGQRRRVANWAVVVRSGRDLDVDYLVRFCARMSPIGFNAASSPPQDDHASDDLAERLRRLCGEVLAAPDSRPPAEWATEVLLQVGTP